MDEAHKQTDKTISELERRIHKVYSDAQHDIENKTAAFWEGHAKRDANYRKQLEAGKITKEQYQAWMRGQVFQGDRWAAKRDQITRVLTNADKVAQQIINGEIHGVFANNANWMFYTMEHGAGVDFGFQLYSTDAVARLLRDQPRLLPKYKLDIPKDRQWNKTLISQQITQGIIQGESLDKIAKRLELITDRDENLCRTRARTAMTGAQNAGRQESISRANGMGIHTKKQWLSTLDGHTRTEHRDLDGQSVEENESFRIGLYRIRFPGDPQAAPAMVYNCRCTMISDVVDYPDTDEDGVQRRDNISGQPIRDMSYKEWLRAKGAGGKSTAKWSAKMASYKTIKDAIMHVKESIAASVSFPKVTNLAGMNEFVGTLDDLKERFPIKTLRTVKANGRLSRSNARACFSELEIKTSYLNGEDKIITDWVKDNELRKKRIDQYKSMLGKGQYSDKQLRAAIKEYEEDIKYSRWSVSSTREEERIARTITHEYGHILADQYFGQINGRMANENFSHEPENALKNQGAKVRSVYKKSKENGDIYKISRYAATNEYEFFAETFAMYATGEELPDYIKDMIEEVVKNGRM